MKQEFQIYNMSCAACAKAVERVCKKLEGVSKLDVNIATEKIVVLDMGTSTLHKNLNPLQPSTFAVL